MVSINQNSARLCKCAWSSVFSLYFPIFSGADKYINYGYFTFDPMELFAWFGALVGSVCVCVCTIQLVQRAVIDSSELVARCTYLHGHVCS